MSHQVCGHWEGLLSSSALSTATAISALAVAARHTLHGSTTSADQDDQRRLTLALAYLQQHQNEDGGWGDTDKSHSNIATTMLVVAAVHLAGRAESLAAPLERASALPATAAAAWPGCGGGTAETRRSPCRS